MTKEEIEAEITELKKRVEDAEDWLTLPHKSSTDEKMQASANIEKWKAMVREMEMGLR